VNLHTYGSNTDNQYEKSHTGVAVGALELYSVVLISEISEHMLLSRVNPNLSKKAMKKKLGRVSLALHFKTS